MSLDKYSKIRFQNNNSKIREETCTTNSKILSQFRKVNILIAEFKINLQIAPYMFQ